MNAEHGDRTAPAKPNRERLVSLLIEYETGEMSPAEIPAFFQRLHDEGMLRHLQGSYHRQWLRLLDEGLVSSCG